jgi:hypothetical protein
MLEQLPSAFLAAFTAERRTAPEAVAHAEWRPYRALTHEDLVTYVQAKKPLYEAIARVIRGESWAPYGAKHGSMLSIIAALQDEFGPIVNSGHLFERSCEDARRADPNTKASPGQWDEEFAKWWARGEAEHARKAEAIGISDRLAASMVSVALVEAAAEVRSPFTKAALNALVKKAKDPNHAAILKAASNGGEVSAELEPALESCGRWVASKNPGIAPADIMVHFAVMHCSTSGLASFRQGLEAGYALAQDKDAWRRKLISGENEKPIACAANAVSTLCLHPDTAGALAFDTRACNFVFLKPVPWARPAGPLVDSDYANIGVWLTRTIGVTFTTMVAQDALTALRPCVPNYDPVAQYLERCVWDGVPRLDTWLQIYAGAEDSTINRAFGRKTLIAAAARALKPGCKVDTILVLEGMQGAKKSTLLKALCTVENWFAEHEGALSGRDKDVVQAIACGPWIVELGELAGLRRTEVNTAKQFASRTTDRFRPPYGRVTEEFPRKVVFIASTNDEEYLQDLTGNRRWWPVKCGECSPQKLVAVRDLLWAEAVHAVKQGEIWWLEDDLIEDARDAQALRLESDVWDEELAAFLDKQTKPVSMRDLLLALGLPAVNANARESQRVRGLMVRAGWVLGPKERRDGLNTRFWRRKGWAENGIPTLEDAAKLIAEG